MAKLKAWLLRPPILRPKLETVEFSGDKKRVEFFKLSSLLLAHISSGVPAFPLTAICRAAP